jgi:hypothetical protein
MRFFGGRTRSLIRALVRSSHSRRLEDMAIVARVEPFAAAPLTACKEQLLGRSVRQVRVFRAVHAMDPAGARLEMSAHHEGALARVKRLPEGVFPTNARSPPSQVS